MKGHMQDGKFHPHTDYKKGTRKSREQNTKSKGVRLERNSARKPVLDGEGRDTRSRLITVPIRLHQFLGDMSQLRIEELEELKGELQYLSAKSYEERVKKRKMNEGRSKRYAFDEDDEPKEIVPDYSIGDIVMVSPENDNEGYNDFRNKKLRITLVAINRDEHRGFDEGVGQALYELETLDGEQIGSSLYDYELVSG